MIKLIDRDGDTVRMTKEEIAEGLRDMGNPPGIYYFVPQDRSSLLSDKIDSWRIVLMFRPKVLPKYSRMQVWRKKWRWYLEQKRKERWFKDNNPMNLIWEPTPFVLERPWLKLVSKKAVAIYVR